MHKIYLNKYTIVSLVKLFKSGGNPVSHPEPRLITKWSRPQLIDFWSHISAIQKNIILVPSVSVELSVPHVNFIIPQNVVLFLEFYYLKYICAKSRRKTDQKWSKIFHFS